jgi:hypothetical protein
MAGARATREREAAMVSMAENWADVAGTVARVAPSEREGFVAVDVAVDRVEPVAGVANLLEGTEGQTVTVQLPVELADSAGVEVGAPVAWRLRRGGLEDVFADPDRLVADYGDDAFA